MSAHPFEKYLDKDSSVEGSDIDYEKNAPHPFESYLDKEEPNRIQSLISSPVKGAIKGFQKGLESLSPLIHTGPIRGSAAMNLINQFLPTQQKGPEQLLERAGELVPAVIGGPESLALKGAQVAAGALGGEYLHKAGAPEWAQSAAEIVGITLPGLLENLGLKVAKLFGKGGSKVAGKAAAQAAKLKPEEIKQAVQESAARLGVQEELPLSAQVSNPLIQSIETKITSSAKGAPLQKKVEGLGEKLVEKYKGVGNQLSKRENLLPGAVSEEASQVLGKLEKGSEDAYRSLYYQASKMLPVNAATKPEVGKAIIRVMKSTANNMKSSLGTPSKDALYNRLSRLEETWAKNPEIMKGNIPIRELETLKQDLNQVIKYETKGGVDKMLSSLRNVSKEGIQSYGREFNKPYLTRFNEAERRFAENAKTFRSEPLVQNIIAGKNPEQIFNKMNNVKGINDLEKVFSKSPEGKQMFDAIKKYKLEDLLNDKIMDKSGNISWGKAAGMFKDPKTRELVSKLVGSAQYKKLKDLATVANGVEEGFKKFVNTSRTTTTAVDMALLVALPIKAVTQTLEAGGKIVTGNISGGLKSLGEAAKTTGTILLPKHVANLMADPKFVEEAILTAKAGKGKNPSSFFEHAKKVARITSQQLLAESKSTESNENPQ